MVLLSFDIEEFDVPMEHGVEISMEQQMAISLQGTERILSLLEAHNVKATFFCTATFAINAPDIIQKIVKNGHEIASHGYYHSDFKVEHLAASKKKLEEISGKSVIGFRMARMMPVDEQEVANAGYIYNSSINPTFIPGRYNNLWLPRTYFYKDGVLQLPASVTPLLRFPLFWLSFHNLPLWVYRVLSGRALKKDGYLNIYFHPWEFADIRGYAQQYKLPGIMVRNSGIEMVTRLGEFITYWKNRGESFGTTIDFVMEKIKN